MRGEDRKGGVGRLNDLQVVPAVAGKSLSPDSLWRRLDPYPAVSPGCTHPFLPWGRRPHVTGKAFGTRDDPCNATSTGNRITGLQSFADVQSPPLARPPGRTHRSARRHWAARPFTPRIARWVTPAGMWYRYVTDLGNCHGWTRTSWIPVLSAAPSRIRLSDKNSCFRPREALRPCAQADQPQLVVQVLIGEP